MIQQVLMPKLGQTMEEATIERWHKAEGDAVKRGDVLLEITTDKATLEVEAYVAGTLRKILAREGETLPVNAVIALVGEPADQLPENLDALKRPRAAAAALSSAAAEGALPDTPAAAPPTAAIPMVLPPAGRSAAAEAGRMFASPRARRRAREAQVPLGLLKGTGPGGRIVEADVVAYAERAAGMKATPMARKLACERGVDLTRLKVAGRITRSDVLAARPSVRPPRQRRPLSAMRRVIAERMTYSKQQIPHFYLTMDVDMGAAIDLRQRLNEGGHQRIGFHDLLIRACALAFVDEPAMNAEWAGDAIVLRSEINIGLAVALDEGLIVPVVRDADRLSLAETAAITADLIDRARSKRLTPDEFQGGVFTISNLGMYGVDSFQAVINPGESAILGVGRIAERVVAEGGWMQARPMATLCLSGDHRVIDGAIAARFLAKVRDRLMAPEELVA